MWTIARTLTIAAIAALAAGGTVLPAADPAAARRNIGGPGDFALRETLVRRLGQDAVAGREKLTVILVNGGVVYSGEVSTWTARRRILSIAAEMRGVINVTDQMTIRPASLPDETLRKTVAGLLAERADSLAIADLDVRVEGGVASLRGKARDFTARVQAEAAAGEVAGIVRVVNHLKPANAPSGTDDASIAAAIVGYIGEVREFPYPGEIAVSVANGVARLSGRVAYVQARQQASVMASLVGGVQEVETTLEVDPSVQMMHTDIKVAP